MHTRAQKLICTFWSFLVVYRPTENIYNSVVKHSLTSRWNPIALEGASSVRDGPWQMLVRWHPVTLWYVVIYTSCWQVPISHTGISAINLLSLVLWYRLHCTVSISDYFTLKSKQCGKEFPSRWCWKMGTSVKYINWYFTAYWSKICQMH